MNESAIFCLTPSLYSFIYISIHIYIYIYISITVAGDYCEFRAWDHCNDPVVVTSAEALQMFDPAMKMTTDESPFCVNGGSCHRVDNTGIDQQQNDYYCLCVGDPRGGGNVMDRETV